MQMPTAQRRMSRSNPKISSALKHSWLWILAITFISYSHSAQAISLTPPESILVAQSEQGDGAYDPFTDFSEFDEKADEEEDINFFKNGRLVTVGFNAGIRNWTESLEQIYTPSMSVGIFLCYFFDLRFALQFGFQSSDHSLSVEGPTEKITGTVGISDFSFNLKYYFNTQNVTRGLADLNPYIVGGFSQVMRTITVANDNDFFGKDTASSFNAGLGIEIPMLRNKMFFGLQALYQVISFPDESKQIEQIDNVKTGITPNGDSYTVLGILGVNF